MKVLLATQYFYPHSSGGTESYVLNLARSLKTYDCEVAILKVGYESNYSYQGIPVYVIPFLKNDLDQEYNLELFESILREFNPVIFHLHTLHSHLNGVHLKRASILGIKCYFTAHLPNVTCPKGDLLYLNMTQCSGKVTKKKCLDCILKTNRKKSNVLTRTTLYLSFLFVNLRKKFSAINSIFYTSNQIFLLNEYALNIFVHSKWQKYTLDDNGFNKAKTEVIPLGIKSIFFTYESTNIKTYDICFIGRFSEEKGLNVLISALKLLESKFSVCLIISLNENQKSEVLNIISNVGEKHSISINYNLNEEKIIKKLDASNMLVVPSTWIETGPFVVLEALSRKVPVLGSNIGGIKNLIIPNENGYLFEMNNAAELAKMIRNFSLQLSEKKFIFYNRQKIITTEMYAKRILKTYRWEQN